MLADLFGWVASRNDNRRKTPRVKRPYRAAYTTNNLTWQPAIGVDMSTEGLCIVTQQPVAEKAFNLRATLHTRVVNMRVQPVWQTTINHNGRPAKCYGCKFVGIAADDWDAIVRWTAGETLGPAENKAQDELQAIRMREEDVARLIPAALQTRLLHELVKLKRLAPIDPRTAPLVQYDLIGITNSAGRKMVKVSIHSKFAADGKHETRFRTRFMFDENGGDVSVLS